MSFYELIAQPRTYHGKRVRVIGFTYFHDEENAIFASREDRLRRIYRNGILLSGPQQSDSLLDRDVVVEATFDAKPRESSPSWGGTLLDVTRIEPIQDWNSVPNIDLEALVKRK